VRPIPQDVDVSVPGRQRRPRLVQCAAPFVILDAPGREEVPLGQPTGAVAG
jgi:hypothetical protein